MGNTTHPVSHKRHKDYDILEQQYQDAQNAWSEDEGNKVAWWIMWDLIGLAVFNCMNKYLEDKLPRGEIEERSLDITCNIMAQLKKKRKQGKEWKVRKLSSFVYLPCLYRYNQKWRQWDEMLLSGLNVVPEEEMKKKRRNS